MPDEPEVVQVPVSWVGIDEPPILLVNQFLGQFQGDEFIITLGQLAPPILLGTDEEKLEEARRLSFIPVKVLARFGLTRARVEELIRVLQQTIENYENQGNDGDPQVALSPSNSAVGEGVVNVRLGGGSSNVVDVGARPRRVPAAIPRSQVYYWTLVWQQGMEESRAALAAGDYEDFDSAADLIRWLLDEKD